MCALSSYKRIGFDCFATICHHHTGLNIEKKVNKLCRLDEGPILLYMPIDIELYL